MRELPVRLLRRSLATARGLVLDRAGGEHACHPLLFLLMTDQADCISCGNSFPASSGNMTAEGMKCQPCSMAAAPQLDELTSPAGPMPGKLKVVVALLGLGVLLNFLSMSLISVAFGIALLVGILVGNDGVRKLIMILAWISLVFSGVSMVLLVSLGYPLGVALGAFGLAQNIFLIWALKQNDVRDWMFKTAFKAGL